MADKVLKGEIHTDPRGQLEYFNTFDLAEIKRMYRIKPANTQVIRAWQGHKIEKKWFYPLSGSFAVNLFPLENFDSRDVPLQPEIYLLQASEPSVLCIPGGTVNGFRALEPGSDLLVFSNATLESSKNDDFRFPLNTRTFTDA